MYRILAFLTKKSGMSTADFIDYYENRHVPLVNSLCGPENMPLVYKRRYTHRDNEEHVWARASTDSNGTPISGEDGLVDFDAVTELVFKDRAAQEAWGAALEKNGGGKVAVDEAKFLDRSRIRAHVVEEFVTCG